MRASPCGLALLIHLAIQHILWRGLRENAAPQDTEDSQRIEITAVQSKSDSLRGEITGAVW